MLFLILCLSLIGSSSLKCTSIYNHQIFVTTNLITQSYLTNHRNFILNANPVTSEGSNYGKYTNEEDAFLWFDEALFYVRAGSGGAGSNAVKFG